MIFGSTFEKGASVSYPISETDFLSLMCSRWLGIYKTKKSLPKGRLFHIINCYTADYLLNAVATSTATATVAPTIGLLPIPRKPIIST